MKKVFSTALALYDELSKLAEKGLTPCEDTTGAYEKFHELHESHNFNNLIYKNAKEHYGVQWCTGEVMVPANYTSVKYFNYSPFPKEDCLVIASRNGKDYLINYLGEEIFEADELKPNLGSICPAMFCIDGKWGIVGATSNVLIPAKYDFIQAGANEFYWLFLDGKEGFIAGADIIEPKFDTITFEGDDDTLVVTLNGRRGYVDENGDFTEEISQAYYNMQMFL